MGGSDCSCRLGSFLLAHQNPETRAPANAGWLQRPPKDMLMTLQSGGGVSPEAVAVVDGLVDLARAGEAVGEALEVQHEDARQRVQLHHLPCRHAL